MATMQHLPNEILEKILTFTIVTGFRILPCPTDTPLNDMKHLTEDCELASEYDHYLSGLEIVCRRWKEVIRHTCAANHWFICDGVTEKIPSASRVQYRDGVDCECHRSRCPFKAPRRTVYIPTDIPTGAFISFGSIHSSEAITQLLIGGKNRDLRILSIAVDFTCAPRFSLPELSQACPNLTHLCLSEFDLPEDPDEEQTLDLPSLTTLALNFFSQRSYDPESVPKTAIHHSFHHWNLPVLRNLSLQGFVDEDTSPIVQDIHSLIYRTGPKLEGLTYYITARSQTKEVLPHDLPSELWNHCPNLRFIQVPLVALFAVGAPKPPENHPRLTVTPICYGNLKSLRDFGYILWPDRLFYLPPDHTTWPIEKFCASSSWGTLQRKLLRYDQEDSAACGDGEPNPMKGYWRSYFFRWISLQIEKGYALEDRYGIDIGDGAGAGPNLLWWLRGGSSDGWSGFTSDLSDMDEDTDWTAVRAYE